MKYLPFILLLTGCLKYATLTPQNSQFQFDYSISEKNQDELWTAARNYFATTYKDLNAVMEVQDKSSGLFIGKGATTWGLVGNVCSTYHSIRFKAKDGKARLRLEIVEEASPACKGWPVPSEEGLIEITKDLKEIGKGLDSALKNSTNAGKGFEDF